MTTRLQPVVLYRRLGSEATKRLTRGVLLLLPLMITFWLVQFAYETIDGLLQPLISAVSGEEKPGLSFGIIIAALFIVGVMSSSLLLKTPGYLIERGIVAIPGVGSIYSTTKKLLPASKPGASSTGFDTVVRVEYPRRGVWAVGFLMTVIDDGQGMKFGVVYMPSTPMPQSGWLMQLPLSEIQKMDWTSAEAMQYIVSAGVTCPSSMKINMVDSVSWPRTSPVE